MSNLERLEFWTNVEPALGVRRAIVGQWLGCTETVDAEGRSTMVLDLHRDNAALRTVDTPEGESNADEGRVLRAAYGDGSIIERRIETKKEENRQGDLRVSITAHGMLHELGFGGMVFRSRPGGSRTYHFQASSQTAAQHLANYVLPALWEAGQSYWQAGELETEGEAVTVVYDMDSPLSALRKLVTAHLRPVELDVSYDVSAGVYRINLLSQRGATAPPVRLRAGLGVTRLGVTRSVANTINRVYGFGGTDPEVGRATMGLNVWDGLNSRFGPSGRLLLTLGDIAGGAGPIAYSGQYTGDPAGRHRLLSLDPEGTQWYIVSTNHETQEFEVDLAQAGRIGGWLRIAAPTRELAYVEKDVGAIVRAGFIERPEVAGVVNFIDNPIGRQLNAQQPLATLPLNWLATGTPTTSLETNPIYVRSGVRSVRVTFTDLAQRVRIHGVGIGAILTGPVSYYADVLTLSGQVQADALIFLRAGVTTFPDGSQSNTVLYPDRYAVMHPGAAAPPLLHRSAQIGEWERLGIESVHDATTYPVLESRVEIRPLTVPSTCIIDAAQITNTATWRDLVEGGGGAVLIQAANAELLATSKPSEEISVTTLDLSSLDDETFPFHNYVVGGRIEIVDPLLDKIIRTRVQGWSRDWLVPESLSIQLASGGTDVTRVLASREATAPPPAR